MSCLSPLLAVMRARPAGTGKSTSAAARLARRRPSSRSWEYMKAQCTTRPRTHNAQSRGDRGSVCGFGFFFVFVFGEEEPLSPTLLLLPLVLPSLATGVGRAGATMTVTFADGDAAGRAAQLPIARAHAFSLLLPFLSLFCMVMGGVCVSFVVCRVSPLSRLVCMARVRVLSRSAHRVCASKSKRGIFDTDEILFIKRVARGKRRSLEDRARIEPQIIIESSRARQRAGARVEFSITLYSLHFFFGIFLWAIFRGWAGGVYELEFNDRCKMFLISPFICMQRGKLK